jgi:hypothetical protein
MLAALVLQVYIQIIAFSIQTFRLPTELPAANWAWGAATAPAVAQVS